MRQVANKADRIGQHDLFAFRQIESPHRRVERCKQLVLHIHIRVGQRIEERGLAGVGIADQGDRGNLRTDPVARLIFRRVST